MPADLDIRFALLLGRILQKVIIQRDPVLWVEGDDRAATVVERPQTLSTPDFDTRFDSWIVFDAPDQHGADGDDRYVVAGRTLDYHDRAAILAEDVESPWFVDCLWVDGVVTGICVRCRALKSKIV